MDTWTLKHLDNWLRHEFSDDIADMFRPAMVEAFNSDPEFWGSQSYWKLYDYARQHAA